MLEQRLNQRGQTIYSLQRSKGGQFVLPAKALPGNPYDGHILATIMPDIEQTIGNGITGLSYIKNSHRMDSNDLAGPQGDSINAVLAATGYSFRLILNWLARVPTRWNHLVEKNSRKFNGLSTILSQKWFPLLAFML